MVMADSLHGLITTHSHQQIALPDIAMHIACDRHGRGWSGCRHWRGPVCVILSQPIVDCLCWMWLWLWFLVVVTNHPICSSGCRREPMKNVLLPDALVLEVVRQGGGMALGGISLYHSSHPKTLPRQRTALLCSAHLIRSGAVFRSEGSPSNPKDLCHFLLEVKDVCRKHRRSFGFKGQPHKSFRSKGLARVPSMKSI